MVKPLDAFLRDTVRPFLKEKGFSKKGRDFRFVAPNGDTALIGFQSWRLGLREVEFNLDVGILPVPWVEWLEQVSGVNDQSIGGALWWKRLFSPFTYMESPFPYTDTWIVNLDDNERIDVLLGALGAAADRLRILVDRRNLISVVRDSATAVQDLRHSREHSMALLLVDDGPSRELDELLQVLEARDPDDKVASWVRAKLAAS
ncbi:DUF4304 domain-containing protein [Labedaea rhizosphaerae]|uniref:Uncharacterized protein DUF4304 n=1 Tax=Labedaea rhizosphaerae TaxID=598644 RepID=A0A4R6RUD7_LABRH|nr:DUF4304 domain-containing protein [Labedaea rhizosphaerae]TDP90561.1 uncharacterized protein DUF4304 [Labedaea rhizosphaerae]